MLTLNIKSKLCHLKRQTYTESRQELITKCKKKYLIILYSHQSPSTERFSNIKYQLTIHNSIILHKSFQPLLRMLKVCKVGLRFLYLKKYY